MSDSFSSLKFCLVGKCPKCGKGPIMNSWFKAADKCEICGLCFKQEEEGAFLGAMILNYGIIVFGCLPILLFFWKSSGSSVHALLYLFAAAAVILPFIFYPLSWKLWIWIYTRFLSDNTPE